MDLKVIEMLSGPLTVIILLPEAWDNERWSVLVTFLFALSNIPVALLRFFLFVFFPTLLPHLLVLFSPSPISLSTIFLHLFFPNNCTEEDSR